MIDRVEMKAAEINMARIALVTRARRMLEAAEHDARVASVALAALELPAQATLAIGIAAQARELAASVRAETTPEDSDEA